MNKPKVNDFFCGAGGMGLGFKFAGFEIAGAWDFDKYAVQSYAHNVGNHVEQADITQMKYSDIPAADVWTFGFPCQDLSNAGKQAGLYDGKRSKLFFEVMRLLDEAIEAGAELPKILMAENVKGLKKYLPVLKEEYNKRGYRMTFTIYNSKYWGVPQNRDRYFVVGIREDIKRAFQFPRQQKDYIPKLSGILETEVEQKYYMTPEKTARIIRNAGEVLRVREATKKGYAEAVEGDSINISHPNSQTRRGRVGKQVAQTLLTGQEQLVVESTAKEMQSVFVDESGVAHCSDSNYSKGLAAGDVGNGRRTQIVDEDFRIRKLTPREYARLQGFPDDYEQIVSNNQFYKQMGNAVTVNVAQAIAEHLAAFIQKKPYPKSGDNLAFQLAAEKS